MSLNSEMRTAALSGLRALLLVFLALVMMATVWVTLISGLVVVLKPVLGPGGALLSVAGGVTAICLLVFVGARLAHRDPPRRPESSASAPALSIGALFLGTPRGRRIVPGATGILLIGTAFLPSALQRLRAERPTSETGV